MAATGAQAFISDLSADWSDTVNPNGYWRYREGATLLSSIPGGWPGDPWLIPQPGWVNGFTPFLFKSNGSELFAHDWSAGDVVVHTANPGDGANINVAWTSDFSGTVDVSGNTWMGRDIGRSTRWEVYKNGTLLTDGALLTGSGYNSGNKFNLAAGSGGASVLNNISVVSGDVLELRFSYLGGGAGDYVGMNFRINASPTSVPEPFTMALAGVGALSGYRRMRRRKMA